MRPLTLLSTLLLTLPAAAGWPSNFIPLNVASGWTQPVGLTFAADGRMLVWEKSGRVWLVENGIKSATPLLDLSQEVGDWRDYGMLGFTLDPNFLSNGYIYCAYVVDWHHARWFGTPTYNPNANEYFHDTIGRVTRYQCNASDGYRSVNYASRTILIGESLSTGVPICHQSHGIGSLAFGADGTLLLSCGDAASYDEVDVGQNTGGSSNTAFADGILQSKERIGAFRAQLVDSHDGKLLRLDPATGNGVVSNPFYDAAFPRAPRSRVWALGLRNPCRMFRVPNTGVSDPAAANPGVFLIGDVGWNTREEFMTCDAPGQNFGWPLYEGLTATGGYFTAQVENQDAPNPLAGGSCSAFFKFQNLLVQETLGTPSWPNPCNTSVQVPSSIPRFMHERPWLEYGHGGVANTGIFSGNNAAVISISNAASPIAGFQFNGNCAIGGAWYTGTSYPATWQNSLFVTDYVGGWVHSIAFDASLRPTAVRAFGTNLTAGAPVAMATDPITGDLHFIDYTGSGGQGAVKRLAYVVNTPPVVVATPAVSWGASPLSVAFSSAGTFDPENHALSYLWTFQDGTTSALANPTHVFDRFDDVTSTGTVIARVLQLVPPGPQGGGSHDPNVIKDGVFPPVGSNDDLAQYDTYHAGAQGNDDWIGYSFASQRTFQRLVFQEGKHFTDGGFWDTLQVEVWNGSAWTPVSGLVVSPAYAGNNGTNYETYVLDFAPLAGTQIRLRGDPGGTSGFISVGELRVLVAATPATGPLRRNVTLRVTDSFGASATTTILVSVDNTPPQVTIQSPAAGALYPLDAPSNVDLIASVVDAEHSSAQIFCSWQAILHHDDHVHPEIGEPECISSAVVDPLGCDGHAYFYEFHFVAQDAGGLVTELSRYMFPNCCASDAAPDYCLFCNGDGASTACPCGGTGITGNGCPNSVHAEGGHLGAIGLAQVTNDSLVLDANHLPSSTALFFQGTDMENGGAGSVLGDGLLCVGGSLIRLRTKPIAANSVSFPEPGDPSVSVRGLVPAAGATMNYQVWYRNSASYCTPATFNTTNAVRVLWVP
ncbi:MAG: PQQ-dependent sugar dehydrogenase [Planctomycetes bacterium]|nr:PQQ-dependent sugar dehydrogenase [Planctomycetota bacterium]